MSIRDEKIITMRPQEAQQIRRKQREPPTRWARRSGQMVLIMALLPVLVSVVSGEHALSEVWSDSDGLQMKYSTNHDDLLSTKGSELSLSTNNKHHAAAAPADEQANEQTNEQAGQQQQQDETSSADQPSSEGAESARPSAGAASEDSDSESSAEGANTEQGVDSSRQIPLRAQVRTQQQQTQKFSEPSSKYRNSASKHNGQAAAEDADGPISYESAQADVGDDSADAPEQTNVDPGAESESANGNRHSENSVAGRFHRPGRLFKEAVRMQANEASDAKTDSDDFSDDESSSSSQQRENAGKQSGARGTGTNVDGSPINVDNNSDSPSSEANDESSGNSFANTDQSAANQDGDENELQAAKATRQQNTMIDFDQLANGPGHRQRGTDAFDDRFGESSSSRSGHRQPAKRPVGVPMQHAASAGPSAGGQRLPVPSGQRANSPPTSYRALPYFRNQVASEQVETATRNRSPDSERDNFISPGHFPGSMAHLTQAASETQKKEQAVSQPAPAADQISAAASSSVQESSQQVAAASDNLIRTAAPTQTPAFDAVSEDSRQAPSAQVTPEPQSQPESQQIMAPILMSTTTMAPMPASLVATTTASVGNTNQTASAPPSLKRFKFRKYR